MKSNTNFRSNDLCVLSHSITSIQRWQSRWETTTKGRWTFKLIPEIIAWISRKHGECSYHTTQFLSGHGGYRKYLHRFGHDTSPLCPGCQGEEEDTEHAVFHCTRFQNGRGEYEEPRITMELMLQSEHHWQEVESRIIAIQQELRRSEKVRNNRTNLSI